jgi:putative membrane protein
MSRFLTPAGERAFRDAVTAIEGVSSVEVVIAVRPSAQRGSMPAVSAAVVAAAAMLAYTLYADAEFPLWAVLALPFAVAVAAALLALTPPLHRWLVSAHVLDHHVLEIARATFVERGVHATRDRSGLLVFISLLERRVALIGDVGVERAVGKAELARWTSELTGQLAAGGEATAKALAGLAPALAKAMPRRADDTNELPDAVVTTAPRGLARLFGGGR